MWRRTGAIILTAGCFAALSSSLLCAADEPPAGTVTLPPALFSPGTADQVFEDPALRPADFPEFEAISSGIRSLESTLPADPTADGTPGQEIELVQYPLVDSAAREEDPAGRYAEPRWNPFPHLMSQLDALLKDQHGLKRKEVSAIVTTLPAGGDDLGITTLDVRGTMYFARLPIVQMTPRFGWHLLNGPVSTDVPSQLYDAGFDVSVYLPLAEKWSLTGTIGPSIFTDGQNVTSSSYRTTGLALGMYQWTPTTKFALGFVYLDREDIRAIPAAGVFYRPSEDLKIDLFFPRPKISYRLSQRENQERWIYLAGELGGGSWAVQRANGVNDVLSYRDLRLIAGYESVKKDVFRWLVEAGFAFNREVEYLSGIGNANQPATGLIRSGLAF